MVDDYRRCVAPEMQIASGKLLYLTAVISPTPSAAAEYYPAVSWLSLIHVPEKNEFPGTGPDGNGIAPNIRTQGDWIRMLKSGGCTACHQLGTKGTRELPAAFSALPSSKAAWERRIQSGQAGSNMIQTMT